MKKNERRYQIYLLLIVFVWFNIIRPLLPQRKSWRELIDGTRKFFYQQEGFFTISQSSGGIPKVSFNIPPAFNPCDWKCEAKKAAEELMRKKAAELEKKKNECFARKGAWDGNNCHEYKQFPSTIFKVNYSEPDPPAKSFCEKYQQNPIQLALKCNELNENNCEDNDCCKWCTKIGKCVPNSYTLPTNTIHNVEC